MQKVLRFTVVIGTCLAIGYLSSLVTRESVLNWYPTLKKPFFNPPNEVFAPVWTVLYIMMGISASLIWNRIEKQEKEVKKAFGFFVIQLVLNALWSYLFFGLQNPLLALVEIVLLWLMIYETFLQFQKIDKIAGRLLLPYLVWVSFATLLNGAIWWLNK